MSKHSIRTGLVAMLAIAAAAPATASAATPAFSPRF